MAGCNNMKEGQVYICANCGIELKVVKECTECVEHEKCCNEPCSFECCGMPLVVKE